MVDKVASPSPVRPIIEPDFTMEASFRASLIKLFSRSLIVGSGNPDGVVEANQGALYMDQDAAAGDILYVKRLASVSGDVTLGWRAV